jgi:hypothetical protein
VLDQGDENNLNMRVLASRANKHLPKIRADLELLERMLETYEKSKKTNHVA